MKVVEVVEHRRSASWALLGRLTVSVVGGLKKPVMVSMIGHWKLRTTATVSGF